MCWHALVDWAITMQTAGHPGGAQRATLNATFPSIRKVLKGSSRYTAPRQRSYLATAQAMGTLCLAFWASLTHEQPEVPSFLLAASQVDQHSHAVLLTLLGLLDLYEVTHRKIFLHAATGAADKIATYMTFIDGAPPEFFPWSARNEGCSIADWLVLNLRLGGLTRGARYFEIAEHVWRNALYSNQGSNGGFGHRHCSADRRGYSGEGCEAWWCCSYHGLRGYCRYCLVSPFDGAPSPVTRRAAAVASGDWEVLRGRLPQAS